MTVGSNFYEFCDKSQSRVTLLSRFLSLTVAMARLSRTLRILLQALQAHTRHWGSPPPCSCCTTRW